jgi:peptidoglycan/xylan/chitin deacetylase (PgdA/CDA1 family)
MIFTTSWDDGHTSDHKLLELLAPLGIKGTLYIPQKCKYKSLRESEIRALSNYFEIGTHGLNHQSLTEANTAQIEFEVSGGKNYMEYTTGKKCEMFAYPYGAFNDETDAAIRRNGLLGARIVNQDICDGEILNGIHLPVTLHVCRHTKGLTARFNAHPSNKNSLSLEFLEALERFALNKNEEYSWLDVAVYSYSIFHLWGHSWEIEQQNLWNDLRKFLSFVSSDSEVDYVVNSELFKMR